MAAMQVLLTGPYSLPVTYTYKVKKGLCVQLLSVERSVCCYYDTQISYTDTQSFSTSSLAPWFSGAVIVLWSRVQPLIVYCVKPWVGTLHLCVLSGREGVYGEGGININKLLRRVESGNKCLAGWLLHTSFKH